jgi:hypothetical protein
MNTYSSNIKYCHIFGKKQNHPPTTCPEKVPVPQRSKSKSYQAQISKQAIRMKQREAFFEQ